MVGKPSEVVNQATKIGLSSNCKTVSGFESFNQMKILGNSGGSGGYLSHVEIDTAHFKGNFPESCELHAIDSSDPIPPHGQDISEMGGGTSWVAILPRTKLGPHRRHFFQLQNVDHTKYTHVMLTIHPDGGVKRVRVTGTQSIGRASGNIVPVSSEEGTSTAGGVTGESRCRWRSSFSALTLLLQKIRV